MCGGKGWSRGCGTISVGIWQTRFLEVFPTFSIIDLFQAQCCNAWDQIPIFEMGGGRGGGGEGGGHGWGIAVLAWRAELCEFLITVQLCVKDLKICAGILEHL